MEIEVNNNRISLHDFLMFQAQCNIKLKEKGKENEELQERIDKAIEYIENNVLSYIDEDGLESITDKEENELIKILRGDKE